MARKPRIHFPGATYHTTLRGNGSQEFFPDSADHARFLLFPRQGLKKNRVRVHALLPDEQPCPFGPPGHPHTPLENHAEYGVPIYTVYQRWGKKADHLFQGRLKALFIDGVRNLLHPVRYRYSNPWRVGRVKDLDDSSWPSHDSHVGGKKPWLTTDWVLSHLDD